MTSLKNNLLITLAVLVGTQNSINASSPIVPVVIAGSQVLNTAGSCVVDGKVLVSQFNNPLELNATNVVLVSALAASLIRFWTREGNNNPSRFEWDKIASGEDLANQSLYFVDDEVIGHAGKGSFQQFDPVTGGTKFSKPVAPKGIFGYISAYHKGVIKALGATWLTVVVARILSCKANRDNPTVFFKALSDELTKLGGYSALPKYANIGAGALIAAYLTV